MLEMFFYVISDNSNGPLHPTPVTQCPHIIPHKKYGFNTYINKSLSQEVQTEFFAKNSVIPWRIGPRKILLNFLGDGDHGTQVIKTLLFVRALHA